MTVLPVFLSSLKLNLGYIKIEKIFSLTITEKSTKSLALRFVKLAEGPFKLVWVIAHTGPTHAVSSA